MPMFKAGQQIRAVFANEGEEQLVGYVGGVLVYAKSAIPYHTHLFNVTVALTSGSSGENYGFNNYGQVQGSIEPYTFEGSSTEELINTMRVGEFGNSPDAPIDNHGWSFSFDITEPDRPGTGDGNALSVVWVETYTGEWLLLYDAANVEGGVFHTINQTTGLEKGGTRPGWSLEGINPGRNADANPWRIWVSAVRRCLLVLNNSIPPQYPAPPTYHLWTPNITRLEDGVSLEESYGALTAPFVPSSPGVEMLLELLYTPNGVPQQILDGDASTFSLAIDGAGALSYTLLTNVEVDGAAAAAEVFGAATIAEGYHKITGILDVSADVDILAATKAFADNLGTQLHRLVLTDYATPSNTLDINTNRLLQTMPTDTTIINRVNENVVGFWSPLPVTQPYVPTLQGGNIDSSYTTGKYEAYNGDYSGEREIPPDEYRLSLYQISATVAQQKVAPPIY